MLDVALAKSHGLLDRVVTALWCRAELPIQQTKFGPRYPAFNGASIRDLADAYSSDRDWTNFSALLTVPVAEDLIRYRHDGAHKRRAGSTFNLGRERWHADESGTVPPNHKVIRGMTAVDHANAPLATYHDLIYAALTISAAMIQRRQ